MTHKIFLASSALFLVACNASTGDQGMDMDDHSSHGMGMESSMQSSLDRLNASPRHQEWVDVTVGDRTIHTFVVYPETSEKRPVVLVIHENRGLNDWARSFADQVAEAGYIAVAPDLLSDYSSTIEQTSDFTTEDDATKAIGELDLDQTMTDLQAVADWSKTIPSSNGKIVSAGFCWGGARSFQFATKNDELAAALVFYGTPPEEDSYVNIASPVFGFYGAADERVTSTVEHTAEHMTEAKKSFDYVVYDGAGHAFMRSGEDPNGEQANVTARNAAWERMKDILEDI